MTTYLIHAQNKTYSVKVDYPTITEADKPLEKFVGEKLLTLMNVIAAKIYAGEKGYSIEKIIS